MVFSKEEWYNMNWHERAFWEDLPNGVEVLDAWYSQPTDPTDK